MKRLLFLLLLAAPLEAQESYSISATAGQVTTLDRARLASNVRVCQQLGLTNACTQAEACTAANAPGGASCTAGQARGAGVRIFPGTQPGREEYLTFGLVVPSLQEALRAARERERILYCQWFEAQNQTTKDAECSKAGAPDGCELCQ